MKVKVNDYFKRCLGAVSTKGLKPSGFVLASTKGCGVVPSIFYVQSSLIDVSLLIRLP